MMALRASEYNLLKVCSNVEAIRMLSSFSRRLLMGGPTGRAFVLPGGVGAGIPLPSRSAANENGVPRQDAADNFQLFSQAKTVDQVVIPIDVTTLQIIK